MASGMAVVFLYMESFSFFLVSYFILGIISLILWIAYCVFVIKRKSMIKYLIRGKAIANMLSETFQQIVGLHLFYNLLLYTMCCGSYLIRIYCYYFLFCDALYLTDNNMGIKVFYKTFLILSKLNT